MQEAAQRHGHPRFEPAALAQLRQILVAFPHSKFIKNLASQILADNCVTPEELARLRSAAALQNTLLACAGKPKAPAELPPAPAPSAPATDPQAEAFDALNALILQFDGNPEALDLAASILEDGFVSAEEMLMIAELRHKLEFASLHPRLVHLRELRKPPAPRRDPEPANEPAPEARPEPRRELPSIFEYPVPSFGPETSRKKRGEDD